MKTIISIVIYTAIYAITIWLFSNAVTKQKKINNYTLLFFATLVPAVLSGVRFETGEDYYSYINGFNNIVAGYGSRLEIGFQYLSKFVFLMGLSAQGMLFIIAFLMMLFVSSALNRKKEILPVSISLIVFLLIFYQSSYNVVRLMMAVAITLYNVQNIEKKKFFKFVFFTLIAGSFHMTAYVMLPIYFVYNYFIHSTSLWRKIILYVLTALAVIYFNSITQSFIDNVDGIKLDYYSKYTVNSTMLSMEALKQSIFYLPLIIFGLLNYKECKLQDSYFSLYFSLTMIGTVIVVASIFLQNYVYRLAEYFLVFNVFVIATYYKTLKLKHSYLGVFLLLSFVVLFWLYWYFFNGAHGTYHYKSIFS